MNHPGIKTKISTTILIIILFTCCLRMFDEQHTITAQAKSISKSKPVSVLLIGNSMVSRPNNYTVKYLRDLAKCAGRKITLEYVAHGNEKMKNWANSKHTYGKKPAKKF